MTPDELSERLWRFAARVGKLVDALPETCLGRHVVAQGELNLKSSIYNLQFTIPTPHWLPLCRGGFSALLRAVFMVLALGALSPSLLAITRPPVIVTQPTNQLVALGSDVTFSVTMAGSTTPLLFQWRNVATPISGQTNASLVLTNVQLTDGGTYCVTVQNAGGSVTSSNATLCVVSVANQSVSLGANVSFLVAANPVQAGTSYQWRFNGLDLPNATKRTFVITNAQLASAGAYAVVVSNAAGMVTLTALLDVDPTFTKITTGPIVTDQVKTWCGAWGDYDGDGLLDLVVSGDWYELGPNTRLYHNEGNGQFTTVTNAPIGGITDRGVRATWADVNNDGKLDLFVGTVPGYEDPLFFLNQGNGQFQRVPIRDVMRVPAFTISFGDYDGDGFLDAFVGVYASGGTGGTSSLLHNNGDGTFTVVTNTILAVSNPSDFPAAWVDYDNDGNLDLFALRQASPVPSRLYRNDGQGHFVEATPEPIRSEALYGLVSAWADFDNDGNVDLFFGGYNQPSRLYLNHGDGTFSRWAGQPASLSKLSTGVAAWGDYDNDGYLDLFFYGYPRPILFRNLGDGNFQEVLTGSPVNDPLGDSTCVNWADYDNDGFLDLLVTHPAGPNYLYRNNGNSNNWFKAQLKGVKSNSWGVGARLRVQAVLNPNLNPNPTWQMRTITAQPPSEELVAHFGLGQATNIETLRIEWPSGIVQELPNRAVKQFLTVTEEGAGILPFKQMLLAGSNQTFRAATTLAGPVTYQWQFYGSSLPGETNATLTITNAQLANAGEYTVVVTTADGAQSQTSAPALLTVPGPPSIRTQPSSQIVLAGRDVTLTVGVAPSTTPVSFQWQRNANAIAGATKATLVLTNLAPTSGASYTVVVNNAAGSVTSDVAGLTVVRDASISASLGGNATLLVSFSGLAPLSYQWRFNGLDIQGATTNKYVLTNAQPANVGQYSVVVANAAGSLTIYAPPLVVDPTFTKITTGPQVTDLSSGMTSGSWGDYDDDGYVDLFVERTGNTGPGHNALYHNNHDGTFTSSTNLAFTQSSGGMSVAWADFDNDGRLDLFVANYLKPSLLCFNNGDGTFSPSQFPASQIYCIAVADYDGDGFLDFLLGGLNAPSRLYRNNGDRTFTSMTSRDVGQIVTTDVYGGVAVADYDDDGWPEVFFPNLTRAPYIYHNDGTGQFLRVTNLVTKTDVQAIAGAWGDYDNDGQLDLCVASFGGTSIVYHNLGHGQFERAAIGQTISGQYYSAAWADYDNDGFLDLSLAGIPTTVLFHNNGDGTFSRVATGSIVTDLPPDGSANNELWMDYDNDGFLDLYVINADFTTPGQPTNFLYRNNGNSNAWLKVKLIGTVSNRDAVGAKVRVQANYAGQLRWQRRDISGGDAYNGNQLYAHFGLGDATNVELVRIEWPSGIVQELHDLTPKQFLTVTEPDLTVAPKSVEFAGGAVVTFTASTTIPSPQFQWLFQGNAMAGETKDWLTVSNLTALKAGKYTVVVSRAGTAETASAFGVIEPVVVPAIAQQPQSLTVNPGSGATFVVTATGSPPLAYQWLLNGEAIAGETNASFLVSQVQPADAGEYVVVVTDPGGEVRSVPALLSLVGAPEIVMQPRDQSVSLGASAKFSVVPDGTPPFGFQWLTNGAPIAGATNQAVTIAKAQLADANLRFSVVVSSALGRKTSREAVLTVDATFAKVTTGGLADDLGHYHGQAWGDYDNDGDLDLLMLGLTPADDAIFRNNGDGTFTKVHPSPWERAPSPYVWAYGWGDYDNDGFLDLYFGDLNPEGVTVPPDLLLRNNGTGGFTSVGAALASSHFSAAWADYDNDGLLDLASAQFGPGIPGGQVRRFRNQGGGTFEMKNLGTYVGAAGYVAPAWVDLDNDGWLDLFVTSYGGNNALFLNLGQGAFSQLTEGDLVNDPGKWVASAWGDYDNDGDLDVFVTAAGGQPNALYRNDGHGVFKKMTAAEVGSLVADGGNSWGCAWGDYDNDGWLDLFVANAGGQGNFLYHNNGDGTFTRITSGSLANDLAESITCNWVDYDQDGFLDLFVQNHAWPCAPGVVTPNFLYHNSGNSNHWLAVKCVGAISPRWGTGAKVRLQANIGGRSLSQMRVIDVGATWFGGLSFVAHFGLGDAPRAETVRVEWPSGVVEELLQVPPNRYLTVKETVINLSPGSLDLLLGQSAMLQVTTPLPGASYQWRRDGQPIAGATGATLELTGVSASNMGEYTVVVTRFDHDLDAQVATVSLPIHLQLATKPAAGVPVFEPESVSLGAEVKIQAAVSGTAPLSYQWQLNGADLPGQTNSILNLTNVQLSDAGSYRLVVTNAWGLTVGPEARLDVDTTFTKITSGPIVTDEFEQWSHAWVDYDADGDLDLAIVSTEYPPGGGMPSLVLVIYRNDGNGVFTRQSQSFPGTVAITYYSSWGDYDNDGYPDLFLPVWSQLLGYQFNNILLHNEGNGTFRQVTTGPIAEEGGVSTAAAWGDYNRDGWLDLFVANSEQSVYSLTNWMYLNLGNGAFVKLTPEQVGAPLLDVGVWSAPSWADVDDDGWPDLLVKNNGGTNRLYRNTGTGSFVSVGTGPLVTETNVWWHSTWVDYDNDGDLDLFFTSMWMTNVLFRNEGGWVFRKMTEAEVGPLLADGFGAGAAWGDYDNDGYLDVFVPKGVFSPFGDKSSLYHNNGDGTFTRVTTGSPVNDISYAGACDWVDYDQDGFLDLSVYNWSRQPGMTMQQRLYRNNGNTNHWLVVKCVGTSSPRLGTGAKVRALATIRGKPMWQLRLIDAGGTAMAGQSWYAHFGLGDATNVDLLRIQWPSGIVQELRDVAVGQYLTVTEPARVAMARPGDLGIRCWQGMRFQVEASSDLVNWTPLATVTNVTATPVYTDPGAASLPRRFYRAVGPLGK